MLKQELQVEETNLVLRIQVLEHTVASLLLILQEFSDKVDNLVEGNVESKD